MSSKSTTETFAEWKSASFKDARKTRLETGEALDTNGYHVQAKLPPDLFREFWALIKAKNFSKSTGVQYAIYKLLQDETNV